MGKEIISLLLKKMVEIDGIVKIKTLKNALKIWEVSFIDEQELKREIIKKGYSIVTFLNTRKEEEVLITPKAKAETFSLLTTIKSRRNGKNGHGKNDNREHSPSNAIRLSARLSEGENPRNSAKAPRLPSK